MPRANADKPSRKQRRMQARLGARVESWTQTPNKERLESDGLKMNRPGSQNRKK